MRPSNFLNWEIGYRKEWAIRWRGDAAGFFAPPRILRRWIRIEDGPEIVAIVGPHKRVVVQFLQPSQRQAFRSELAMAPRPFGIWIELDNQNAERGDGQVGIVRTALPLRLEAAPEVVVPDEMLEGIQDLTFESLADGSGFKSGEDTILVLSSPIALATDIGARQLVDLYHAGGWRLECSLQGDTGQQYLLTEKIAKHQARVTKGARFVAVPGAPYFVKEHQDGTGQDLGALLPRVQNLIRAWTRYEEAGKDFEEELLSQRRANPLEYDSVEPKEVGDLVEWMISIPKGVDLLEHWKKDKTNRNDIDIDAEVEIHDLETKLEPVLGRLEKLLRTTSGLKGILTLTENGRVPPRLGKLLAIESRGDSAQSQRRHRALERLSSGECACPDLLGYLLDPSTVPLKALSANSSKHSRFALNEEQHRAVRLGRSLPPLLLIQGPPGTGKTRVIVEMVKELRRIHKRGMDNNDGNRRPLKILITSIQRQAVLNVLEKLQDDFVFVRIIGLDVDRDPMEVYIQQAARIAESLEHRNRTKRNFIKYQDLSSLADMLELARAELVTATPKELIDLLQRISDMPESRSLTPSLRASLTPAIECLSKKADPESPVSTSTEIELKNQLFSLSNLKKELDAGTFRESELHLQGIRGALDRLQSGTEIINPDIYKLCRRWIRFAQKHTDSILEAEIDSQARREWTNLLEESENICGSALDSNKMSEALELRSTRDAVAWIYRASDALSDAIAEYRDTSEAVISDWIHNLRHNSAELREVFYKHAATAASTCQKAELTASDESFDVVIVDEAARAGLDILVPITLARSIVLLGDQKQLPPHVEKQYLWRLSSDISESIDLHSESLFSWLMKHLPIENTVALKEQYRMHEDIGRMVSKVFYEPELKLEHYYSGARAIERAPNFGLFRNRPLVWVDTADLLQNATLRRGIRWPCEEENVYEVDCIMRTLEEVDRTVLERYFEEQHGLPVVGIITFYNRQEKLLRERLSQWNDPRFERLLRIGTVDSFQGHEFPLVLLSCVKSNATGRIGFLKPLQRINVAMSRAQRQLVIFGDSKTLAETRENLGSQQLQACFRHVVQNGDVVASHSFGKVGA